MPLLENILIAISLSMDAFTIAIAEGTIWRRTHLILLSISFGLSQCIMTILGYYLGKKIMFIPANYQKILSFILLMYIGIKMVKTQEEKEENFSYKAVMTLSFITSIDAFSVGIALSQYINNLIVIASIIGITTLMFSLLGVWIGKKIITKTHINPNILGGTILILYALKTILIR